jgi:hypothetical protein
MMITTATYSSAMSAETRRFFEHQLEQDLERRRRHRERLLDEGTPHHDQGGTMER